MLLAAILATLLFTAADPYAQNRDPNHGHIILGGSALDRARALAWHMRYGHQEDSNALAPAAPHEEDEKDGAADDGARVLIIRGGAAAISVLDSSGSVILTTGWSFTPPATPDGRVDMHFSLPLMESDVLTPEPPPRVS